MSFDFHKHKYESHRGPNTGTIQVRMPEALHIDLLALSIAMEEPMGSIVLRLVEEYVDAHPDEVAKGSKHLSAHTVERREKNDPRA